MEITTLAFPTSVVVRSMRFYVRIISLLAIIAIKSPASLYAQFQQPTEEELKMTADPKAPGAAAIYLYYEEITDCPENTYSFSARIKVLAEKGKELATVTIPYERGIDTVKEIAGRTIHSDGTVIPLAALPSDLMEFKTKGLQENAVVFTLPSVEVGSILEYRLKLHRDEDWTFLPDWAIQRPYFVRKAHYSFTPGSFSNMMYAVNVVSDAKVVQDKHHTFTLDITDVPPEPNEDWMPPINTLRWRVDFFSNTGAKSGDEWWKNAGERWADWVQDFTKPTSKIKDAVAGITAPDDSEEKKAEKIYAAVMKLENTAFTRQKSGAERKKEKLKDINEAEDVWKQQAGTDDEIALLYVSLARAAGLKVWPMKVVDRNRAMFDPTYLSTYQLDDYIVVVELDGKDVYLDPGQKMCPFGSMHWKHTLAYGLRLTEKGAVIAGTPGNVYTDSTFWRTADISIDDSGNLKGTVRFVMTGQDALYWRQLALENDGGEVKERFNESMSGELPEGVQADFDHFLGLEDPSLKLMGIVNVSGNIGTTTGKHFFIPGLFFESNANHPFVTQDKRIIPIDVHYPRIEQDDITYSLPPGFTVESAPHSISVPWPDHASLKIDSRATGNSVEIARTLAYNYTILDPKEYSDLHDFYLKVATADQQQLVLTRATAARGN
jgi:Domain of Unknown Function with PDB structure (DUF3857)/Transglutaminase-like superfamily